MAQEGVRLRGCRDGRAVRNVTAGPGTGIGGARGGARAHEARWLALLVLCLGELMIVLDVTIVGVALPSIRADLGFSEASLAWVVNAYLITFGGFLLLGGRLGDLLGHRGVFLAGVAVFTAASAVCGFATSQQMLVAARAVQGIGGAVVSAVSLSLMMTLFTEPAERAKAMGIFGFVSSGGGSLGVLLGGVLTGLLDWHWIFLVNVPVGVLVVVLTLVVISGARAEGGAQRRRAVLRAARARRTGRLRRVPHRRPPGRAGARQPPVGALRRGGRPGPGGHVVARRRRRGDVRAAVDGCARVPADHAARRRGSSSLPPWPAPSETCPA
jgi:MFS family permease